MIYQHPLAYLLGLEGLALLRGWAGDFDRDFVLDRLDAVRRLLADETLARHPGVDVLRGDVVTAYRQWAPTYDSPNGLFGYDEPVVHAIVRSLGLAPGAVVVDAACGTGRLSAPLAAAGHRVIGIDASAEMLEHAAVNLPGAALHVGSLDDLPLGDDIADLVLCGLALSHVADLRPVMAELARVLRPGGDLVISDAHHELVLRGSVVKALGPDGEPGLVRTHRHTPGDLLRAALPAGFQVRACDEPRTSRPAADDTGDDAGDDDVERGQPSWDEWPWSLLDVDPEATRAAWDIPPVIVWHLRLDDRPAA